MGKPLPYIGIDGCPAGWFYVAIDNHGAYDCEVIERFSDIDQ